MRAVTELGFAASIVPERSVVQEAPQSGDSFFDTLSKANETAGEAEKVTDDKPETAKQDKQTAEVKTQKNETKENPEETEAPEEEEGRDVVAEMMALGRMITVAPQEQSVEKANVEVLGAVQALTGDGQGGEHSEEAALLTPVENGEEMLLEQVQPEGVSVSEQSFAETMTTTLGDMLTAEPTAETQPTPELTGEPAVQQIPTETAPEAPMVPTDNAESLTAQVETLDATREIPAAQAQSVEVSEAEIPQQEAAPVARTEAEPQESIEAEDMTLTREAPAAVSSAAEDRSGLADSFSEREDGSDTESGGEIPDVQLEEPEIPMMETLRSRFSLDNAVQQIDNTELAQAVEKAIERFVDDFRLAEVDVQHITIRLDPEELGSMSITVAAENNVLTAKIVTDNKEAASLLSAQIEQFLEAMEQKGIKVEKAEVTYNSQLDLGGQAPNEHGGTAGNRQRTISAISAVEMVEAEEAGKAADDIIPVAAVQDEATNYYVFDDRYTPEHVYKV